MRNLLPGYNISLDRKKQYSQSRLHTAPVGLTITWKRRLAPGMVGVGPVAAVVSIIDPAAFATG
jgi:hypothetical protein